MVTISYTQNERYRMAFCTIGLNHQKIIPQKEILVLHIVHEGTH